MKVQIDSVLSPQASGPWRGAPCIVDNGTGKPRTVAFMMQGEGQTLRLLLDASEARAIGEMFLVCGAIAEGGLPPVVKADPAPVILDSRKVQ